MTSQFPGACGVDHTVEVKNSGGNWVTFEVFCPTKLYTVVRFAPREVFEAETARLMALTEEQLGSMCSDTTDCVVCADEGDDYPRA